ncbi:MAG TPA: endonuclease/exonuclease/phosphatase family protein, partial [Steroidobacteraceae bacterium]|nr:endonuclease/exonuclease/phosphatase family protein [Steroidobacteraceae bacterium]
MRTQEQDVRAPSPFRRWLLPAAAWSWVLLLALWARAVGGAETTPLDNFLLFVPCWPALLPLPVLAGWALARRRPAMLVPIAAGVLLSMSLLAVVFPRPRAAVAGAGLRIFTVNAWGLSTGPRGLAADLLEARPDVVLLQSVREGTWEALHCDALAGFHVARLGQFAIASRWPIEEAEETPDLHTSMGAPWARFTLKTPWGLIDVFNVHPRSPHRSLRGILHGLIHGLTPEELSEFEAALSLLDRQVGSLAAAFTHARHRFVVAGDTNLPSHSRILDQKLGHLHDA